MANAVSFSDSYSSRNRDVKTLATRREKAWFGGLFGAIVGSGDLWGLQLWGWPFVVNSLQTRMKFKRLSKCDIAVSALCALAIATYLYSRGPSESQMIAKFHRQKAEFEQIRLMLRQDKNVFMISDRWVRAHDSFGKDGEWLRELPLNISESRLALYRTRLKNLGLASVRSNPERGEVTFYQIGGGFTDTSWSIGYLWSQKPPSPLVKSAYHQMPGQNHSHYARLEGKWYIYHHR